MLNTKEELEQFKEFLGAGGLTEATNLTTAKVLNAQLNEQIERLNSCVSESVTDYQEAGTVVNQIADITSELSNGQLTIASLISHLEVISEPTDLEQVSIGVSILRRVSNQSEDEPAPSILPITSKTELAALVDFMDEAESTFDEVVMLMNKVNSELSASSGSGGGGGVVIPPSLSNEIKQQLIQIEMVLKLIPENAMLTVSDIEVLLNNSIAERSLALDYFTKAVNFTICNMQVTKPSIKDATLDRFSL